MERDPDGRMAEIQRTTRAACAALRAIFGATSVAEELERIDAAERLLDRLRFELDELERDSAPG